MLATKQSLVLFSWKLWSYTYCLCIESCFLWQPRSTFLDCKMSVECMIFLLPPAKWCHSGSFPSLWCPGSFSGEASHLPGGASASWRPWCAGVRCCPCFESNSPTSPPWEMSSLCVKTYYPLVMTHIAMENGHLQWVFPLEMVIFHGYVKLSEGIINVNVGWTLP